MAAREEEGISRLTVRGRLTLDRIENVVAAAQAEAVREGELVEGAMIHRVDLLKGETRIYLTGDEVVRKRIASALRGKGTRKRFVRAETVASEALLSAD